MRIHSMLKTNTSHAGPVRPDLRIVIFLPGNLYYHDLENSGIIYVDGKVEQIERPLRYG